MRPLNLAFSLVAIIGLSLLPATASNGEITWDVTVNDPGSAYQAYYQPIESSLSTALDEYSHLLISNIPSSIEIEIGFSSSVTRSTGYSATSAFVQNVDGTNVLTQGVASEIATGIDPNGTDPDLYLTFEPSYLTGELWFDPEPQLRSAPVPADKTDAYSVLLHELTHALAFNGWRDGTTGALPGSPPYESTFDQWEIFDGTNLYFTGPAAEASYGGPVPITFGNNFHIGNDPPRPGADLLPDLMNGVVYDRGTRYDLSPLDLAILSDTGLAVLSPPTGDFNADGTIDAADYVLWRKALDTTYTPADYVEWHTHFGQTTTTGSRATAVPEPSTFTCGILALAAALLARRRIKFSSPSGRGQGEGALNPVPRNSPTTTNKPLSTINDQLTPYQRLTPYDLRLSPYALPLTP